MNEQKKNEIDAEYLAEILHDAAESLEDLCTRKCRDDRVIAVANAYYYLSAVLRDEGRIDKDPRNCYPNWIVMDTLNDFPGIIDRVTIDIETDIEKEHVLGEGEVQHRLDVLKERISFAEMSGDLKRFKELFELYTKYEWALINRRYDYLTKSDCTVTPEDEDKVSMKKRIEGFAYNICCDMGLGIASNLYRKCIEAFSKYTPKFSDGYAINAEGGIIAVPSVTGPPIKITIPDEMDMGTDSYDCNYVNPECDEIAEKIH